MHKWVLYLHHCVKQLPLVWYNGYLVVILYKVQHTHPYWFTVASYTWNIQPTYVHGVIPSYQVIYCIGVGHKSVGSISHQTMTRNSSANFLGLFMSKMNRPQEWKTILHLLSSTYGFTTFPLQGESWSLQVRLQQNYACMSYCNQCRSIPSQL